MERQARFAALRARMLAHHAKQQYVELPKDAARVSERYARVMASVAKHNRTVDWLLSLRIDGETGLGDTITRMLKSPKKIADARERMQGLLKRCSCSRSDAVKKLNQDYPYRGL